MRFLSSWLVRINYNSLGLGLKWDFDRVIPIFVDKRYEWRGYSGPGESTSGAHFRIFRRRIGYIILTRAWGEMCMDDSELLARAGFLISLLPTFDARTFSGEINFLLFFPAVSSRRAFSWILHGPSLGDRTFDIKYVRWSFSIFLPSCAIASPNLSPFKQLFLTRFKKGPASYTDNLYDVINTTENASAS